jgi:hypothetical protein
MANTITFTDIPNAYPYAYASTGYVYNMNSKRRIKRQWIGNSWRSNIRRSDGTTFYFRHDDINSACKLAAVTATLAREELRTIPDYPRYAVTPYGAVWCVRTGSRGRNANAPFIVSEHYHRNRRFVTLANKFGDRRSFSTKRLTQLVWGGDSNYAGD